MWVLCIGIEPYCKNSWFQKKQVTNCDGFISNWNTELLWINRDNVHLSFFVEQVHWNLGSLPAWKHHKRCFGNWYSPMDYHHLLLENRQTENRLCIKKIQLEYEYQIIFLHTISIIEKKARVFHLCLFEPTRWVAQLPHAINQRWEGVAINSQSWQQILTIEKDKAVTTLKAFCNHVKLN